MLIECLFLVLLLAYLGARVPPLMAFEQGTGRGHTENLRKGGAPWEWTEPNRLASAH